MNKRGSTLVMTIFLVMLLSVLALSLFTIMVSDKKLVVQQEDSMQSYYLARTGAEIVSEHIINNPLDVPSLNGNTSSVYSGIGTGTFDVSVSVLSLMDDGSPDEVQLISRGTSDDRDDSIELILDRITIDHAIFTNHDLDVNAMDYLVGDLGSNGQVTDDSTKHRGTGDNYEYMDITIQTQEFPVLTPLSNINENSAYNFDYGSGDIDNVRLNLPSGAITFDTSSEDLEFVINDLYCKGDIVISGGGRVTLYIETSANFQTPSAMVDENGLPTDPDQFIIYLDAGSAISLSTPLGFNGRIIGPEATVSMSSGSTLTGSVIADQFFGSSNASIFYDQPDSGSFVTGFKRKEWK